MRWTCAIVLLLMPLKARTELLDRIAIRVDDSIIKDSDISRDIRLTQFLDNQPLQIDQEQRKKSAQKLIDLALLREEIHNGGYQNASDEAVHSEIETLETGRFHSSSGLETALTKYHLNREQLRERLRWQLTVLQFIDSRFKAAAIAQDSAVNQYYDEHLAALKRNRPNASAAELHERAREILVGEEVNRLLNSWLEERRKEAAISFLEDGLS
jgi:hypothetical protein